MNTAPQRIVVYGCAGSGKTTLALKLHKKLNLPLYHLDQYYWVTHEKIFYCFVSRAVIHDSQCHDF